MCLLVSEMANEKSHNICQCADYWPVKLNRFDMEHLIEDSTSFLRPPQYLSDATLTSLSLAKLSTTAGCVVIMLSGWVVTTDNLYFDVRIVFSNSAHSERIDQVMRVVIVVRVVWYCLWASMECFQTHIESIESHYKLTFRFAKSRYSIGNGALPSGPVELIMEFNQIGKGHFLMRIGITIATGFTKIKCSILKWLKDIILQKYFNCR